ncbi:MAG TPA: polysaccharide deacetylase family protein [Sphingomicrobium sp.]|nr:polysaccharide deacetylase family protein [Sphingomicrobium sp.]
MARDRLLLASIHDVSPRFESEVDRLLDLLAPHVGSRLAMLVVPDHWASSPLDPASPFAARLRAWADAGIEMFLHGFVHRDDSPHRDLASRLRAKTMTAGEGEFLGLSREEARERITRGRGLIEQITGKPIAGFVAPAWLYGRGTMDALADCGVRIAEDHLRIWSPAERRSLARGPVITWASRTPARLASSLVSAAALRRLPMPVLRVGVHPPDIRHPSLVGSIHRTLAIALKTRRAGAYADLLTAERPRVFQYSSAASASSGRAK